MTDERHKAEFTIRRNDRSFTVQFVRLISAWWTVQIFEHGRMIHGARKQFPPNFTNAIKVLDEIVPRQKSIRRKKLKVFR